MQEGNGTANNVARLYVHGGRVDEMVASQGGGAWRYHHYDARNNCILLTGPNGTLLEQYDYDAFGFPYFHKADGSKQGPAAYGNRFLFTGREWLGELRLYDYRNRMYQPELGRFLQPDPMQFAAGDFNLYRYCHNDPVNRIDPLGLGDSATVSFVPEPNKLLVQYVHPKIIQSLGDSRGLSVSVPLRDNKADHGISTTVTTNPDTGEIHVEQTVTIRTFLPKSEEQLGNKSSLLDIEAKVVNEYRDKVETSSDLTAKNLAREGFKDAESAKRSVEQSTKAILDKAAFELKLKYDTFHRTK